MKKILTLNILAAALLAVPGCAVETVPAISQLENFPGAADNVPQPPLPSFPMPGVAPDTDPWGFPGAPEGNSTEDCHMEGGVEVCIAPNWPDCHANGDVEPCIDHVQAPYCFDYEIPLWVNSGHSGRWYQGCSAGGFDPGAGTPGGRIEARLEGRRLSVLLGSGKIYFGDARRSSGPSAVSKTPKLSLQEFIDADPCGGLMACGNQIDAGLLEAILAAYSAAPADYN